MNRPILTFVPSMCVVLCGIGTLQAQQGRGLATTVQLPTFGVSIDAGGVIQMQTLADPTGALRAQRVQAAERQLPRDVQVHAPLRKISLTRLERAMMQCRAAGRPYDDVMLNLAGLQNIAFAFVYADSRDVVLVGEAEGWVDDGLGRNTGISTGLPVLRLEYLATALRTATASAAPGFVGCTIDPTADGLARMEQLKANLPRSIADNARTSFATELNRRTRETLGQAVVRVFGVEPQTHLAAVLIEADYRMKRMAVGVEPNPVGIPSYVDRATGAGNGLVRYWFVPEYQRLQTDAERQSLEVLGSGVRLQTEQVAIAADGSLNLAPSPPPGVKIDPAAKAFCDDFTKRFPEIAARSPVFAELRNVVDLLVIAAFMRQHSWFTRADWTPTLPADPQTVTAERRTPTTADVVVNSVWKGRKMISAAGGGVSIVAGETLRPENLREVDATRFAEKRGSAAKQPIDERWWWD
jgi:hypothetical protein